MDGSGKGDAPSRQCLGQRFKVFLFVCAPLHEAYFPRVSCGKYAQGARLRLMFFAFFAKNIKHNAGVK